MTWWQVLLTFWVVGIGTRVDEKLSQDDDFKSGMGLAMRVGVYLIFMVGAWLMVNAWAGISW